MDSGHNTTIIIVSDLHLAAGFDPVSGISDPLEPFLHDSAFAHWLDHSRKRSATSGDNPRLMLLGDLFDFPRVQVSNAGVGGAESAIARLNRIAAGHPAVFAALGRWLGAGNPIDLVPGNHDIELMRPAVQRHLGDLIARAASLEHPGQNLNISPWIYHVPGVLYAEHGQQYHDLNSFPALLRLETELPVAGNMPPGAALDTFVQQVTAKLGPEVDAPDSLFRLVRNIAKTGPRGVARVLPDIARLAAVVGSDLATRGLPQRESRRQRYRADVLPGQARQTGIPVEILSQIDKLAERTAKQMVKRLAAMVLRRRRPSQGVDGTRTSADYLVQAASEVQKVLSGAELATTFYVFGHSHRADQRTIGEGPAGAVYFNSGTWAWQAAKTRPFLTFVTVTWNPTMGEATAALQRWNDDLSHIESVGTPARLTVDPSVAIPS